MRPRLLSCSLLLVAALAGCFGGDDEPSEDSPPSATEDSLLAAYATLEDAAEDLPTARLPRARRRIEEIEAGEDVSVPSEPPKDFELIEYFADRGLTFGLALLKNDEDRGLVLNGIEFNNDPGSITLMLPADLRRGSARQILDANPTFATMARSGEIYCIDDPEAGVEACPAPDLPQE
jgi:hypothetical protein